jgi:biopolymer transport protein ExbB/TolQ
MEEGLLEVLPNIERRTPYLATFANIATLLGLLGTIIGLIAAFTAVANADPAEKASLLSESISIAMNTTAFGLMAAIPLLLVHSVLQSKTSAIVESLEIAVVKFLNLMDGEEPRAAAAAPAPAAAKVARA